MPVLWLAWDFCLEEEYFSSLRGWKLYFVSSRWNDNGCWHSQSRNNAIMDGNLFSTWLAVIRPTSSKLQQWNLFAFPAINVDWCCSKGASPWSLLPYKCIINSIGLRFYLSDWNWALTKKKESTCHHFLQVDHMLLLLLLLWFTCFWYLNQRRAKS